MSMIRITLTQEMIKKLRNKEECEFKINGSFTPTTTVQTTFKVVLAPDANLDKYEFGVDDDEETDFA